jgi:deoxyribodipyrimidine photo-lyase
MIGLPHPLPATRAAATARLSAFLPRAGLPYAALRNEDLPGHPACLEPVALWFRHRLLTEAEVIDATLRAHPAKGPTNSWPRSGGAPTGKAGWNCARASGRPISQGLKAALNRCAVPSPACRNNPRPPCWATTGIDGFDHWAQELVATGYLHNHARMWFASIWIFTLRLPWELGADFFLRHLIDGDPASNTLSWRWVGGLHTPGKTYRQHRRKHRDEHPGPLSPQRPCAQLPAFAHATPPRAARHANRRHAASGPVHRALAA